MKDDEIGTCPCLFLSMSRGATARTYVHVHMVNNITNSSDWKLKRADCEQSINNDFLIFQLDWCIPLNPVTAVYAQTAKARVNKRMRGHDVCSSNQSIPGIGGRRHPNSTCANPWVSFAHMLHYHIQCLSCWSPHTLMLLIDPNEC